MIHPSYTELMAVINSEVEEGRISKEDERKLQVGTPLVRCSEKDKPLSIAVKEFYEGKVKILGSTDENTSL